MKKIVIMLAFVLALSIIPLEMFAATTVSPPLAKVSFPLTVEQWATSTTAKVVVSINATLTDTQLATIHGQIMNNLPAIAGNVDWHITQFNRSKNQSGLEQLSAQAEARIPENELTNLRKNATIISKPGITYSVSTIDFSPSQAEEETVKAHLRQKIYHEVQAEIERLNKIYPTEKFQPYSIEFINSEPTPMPQMNTMLMTTANASVPAATPMAVSNKIILTANVVLAAEQSNS